MKALNYTLRSAVFLAFAFFCSSLTCDMLGDATDVTLNVQLTHTFVVDERADSKGNPVSYSKVEVINADDNADFKEIKSRIKDITITKVTYSASDYAADGKVTFTNGKGSFSTTESGAPFATANLEFQDIQTAASGGTVYTLALDDSGLSQVAKNLKDAGTVYMKASGTFSKTPVAFKVKVKLDCKVTASPVK
ncbi:MAG: hypothetical protein ACOYW3_09090 [Bacteroidota bacterium]